MQICALLKNVLWSLVSSWFRSVSYPNVNAEVSESLALETVQILVT